jgi:hypothetical protein
LLGCSQAGLLLMTSSDIPASAPLSGIYRHHIWLNNCS